VLRARCTSPIRIARLLLHRTAAALLLFGAAQAAEPERHALAYSLDPAATRYVRQYRVEVGDVPRHELRVFDLTRRFTRAAPAIDGVRVSESQERGVADLVDQDGSESAYVIYLLEDGNRVFGRYSGTVQTRRWPDGSRHYDVRGTIELTGGTGRFEAIRGSLTVWQALDPGADSSQGEARGEYWFER
jgi:hypothetical protein